MLLKNLDCEKFEDIFTKIIDNKIDKEESKKILFEINEIGFSSDIFLAAMNVLKSRMKKISAPLNAIDVCGTGGDGLNSLNISTAVCFVVAASGISIAKHGNKAISSKSGSADIFRELNIKISSEVSEIEENLIKDKLCFLFAPFFHESLKNLAQIRKEIALEYNTPTIFNYLGPLLNPANTKKQLIGVSRRDIMLPMIQALKKSGSEKIYLVHGFDKMDEITICDNSYILRLEDEKIHDEEIINPEIYNLKKYSITEIKGEDPKYNAKKLLNLLNATEQGAYYDIVVLNSAFALKLANKVNNIEDGIILAKKLIDNKSALKLLKSIQNNTKSNL